MPVDDYARVAFTAMRPDERKESAESLLLTVVQYFSKLSVKPAPVGRQRTGLPFTSVSSRLPRTGHQANSPEPIALKYKRQGLLLT